MNWFKSWFSGGWGSQSDAKEAEGHYTEGETNFASQASKQQQQRPEPVLQDAAHKNGGIQGLQWYAANQRQDEHGDMADEFFHEDHAQEGVTATKVPAKHPQPGLSVHRIEKGNVILSSRT